MPLDGPAPESLRLFSLCDAMQWNHLPVSGGLYDQRPELLEQFLYIFEARAEQEHLDQERREREMRNKSGKGKNYRRR